MKMFDAGKIRMIGLPYSEKLQQYVKPFSSNTGKSRTEDGRTDRIAMSILRVSTLTRDKNRMLRYFDITRSKVFFKL